MSSFRKLRISGGQDHGPLIFAAMGKRRPEPKALGEILSPGAACWRLYSAPSTMRMTLLHQRQIEVVIGGDLFRGVQVFDIVFEDRIQHVIRAAASQCPSDQAAIPPKAVFPASPAGSPAAANSHNGSGDRPSSWATSEITARPPDHVTVQGAVSHAQFALVSGAENDGAEFVGEGHEQRAAGAGLYVFFGRIFLASGKHFLQVLR